MGTLLHAIRDRKPLPDWAVIPNLYPLPRGPYPATKWPAGAQVAPQPQTVGVNHGRA